MKLFKTFLIYLTLASILVCVLRKHHEALTLTFKSVSFYTVTSCGPVLLNYSVDEPISFLSSCGLSAGCGMSQYPAGSEEGGLDAGGEGEGEGTSLEAWPWNVRLHLGTEVMCLGAILQTGWIITAAHCVHEL